MAIIAQCDCGKKFKAKDSLAGKRVRCPACSQPVRVGAAAVVAAGKPTEDGGGFNPQEALQRYEAAQKKKQETAAEAAAREEEKNALIASYDQLAGKKKKKDQKKAELAESAPKKPTVVTKAADAGGSILSNALVKYLIIAGLFAGGAFGSVKLVQFIVTYSNEQVTVQPKAEDQIRELEIEARRALAANDYAKVNDLLRKMLDLDPSREQHRNYVDLKTRLDKAVGDR